MKEETINKIGILLMIVVLCGGLFYLLIIHDSSITIKGESKVFNENGIECCYPLDCLQSESNSKICTCEYTIKCTKDIVLE